MKTIDRLILSALTLGVWVLIAMQLSTVTPAYAHMDDNELTANIKKVVVQSCRAYLGGGGKTNADIRCK